VDYGPTVFSRTLTRTYELPVSPDEAWSYFTDPGAVAAASSHDLRVEAPPAGFGPGTQWDEQHGADCDFDVVRWSVTALDPGRAFTIESGQSGARQRVTTTLAPSDTGTRVRTTLRLRPSLRAPGGPVERVVVLAVLVTGLGLSLVAGQFDESVADDMAHFGAAPTPADPAG
jgi:uncharacterized protein YndB with AHSA1/START domain